jgi:5'-nucleotidase
MRFLLTNDDGIYAKGLSALYQELSKDADCLIVAPEIEQSAVGHAITIFRPLMVRQARKDGHFLGYAVAGTPADCVKLGIRELSDKPVDLVVSGINRGANVGINVIYSGTVSAATEGAIMGVPLIPMIAMQILPLRQSLPEKWRPFC